MSIFDFLKSEDENDDAPAAGYVHAKVVTCEGCGDHPAGVDFSVVGYGGQVVTLKLDVEDFLDMVAGLARVGTGIIEAQEKILKERIDELVEKLTSGVEDA